MADSLPLLVIQCGNTFPEISARFGDFDHWFVKVIRQCGGRAEIFNAHQEKTLPDIHTYAGVLITGSPAMVTDRAPWSEQLAAWLATVIGYMRMVWGSLRVSSIAVAAAPTSSRTPYGAVPMGNRLRLARARRLPVPW